MRNQIMMSQTRERSVSLTDQEEEAEMLQVTPILIYQRRKRSFLAVLTVLPGTWLHWQEVL
jgi:hypothetical protein